MIDYLDDEPGPAGAPAWMATFADLMSLLMCFFVLLLSFSEIDVQKYKVMAGEMKHAFGIQQEVIADENPSGSEQTVENLLQQNGGETADPAAALRQATLERIQQLVAETSADVATLREALAAEEGNGMLDIESGFRTITIRIKEKGSFASGSAELDANFVPVMARLRDSLLEVEGLISVEGHTDDIDIATARFGSNWALSSARALSVAHELLRDGVIDAGRFQVVGFADTRPHLDNATEEGRVGNRRVELVIRQAVDAETAAGLQQLEDGEDLLAEAMKTAVVASAPAAATVL